MVRKLENIENERKGIETYEPDDGRRVDLSRSAVDRFGLRTVLKHNGLTINTDGYSRTPSFIVWRNHKNVHALAARRYKPSPLWVIMKTGPGRYKMRLTSRVTAHDTRGALEVMRRDRGITMFDVVGSYIYYVIVQLPLWILRRLLR